MSRGPIRFFFNYLKLKIIYGYVNVYLFTGQLIG